MIEILLRVGDLKNQIPELQSVGTYFKNEEEDYLRSVPCRSKTLNKKDSYTHNSNNWQVELANTLEKDKTESYKIKFAHKNGQGNA